MDLKLKVGIILFALTVAVVGSGFVYAYFSDTQTSSGSAFTTGTLLLQVGTAAPTVDKISVPSLKPGDTGNGANWQVQNLGTINGDLTIGVGAINNLENTVNAAELAAGELAGNTNGELGGSLTVAFWMDVDHSNTWSTGDYYLKSDGTTVSYVSGATIPAAAYATLDSFGGKTWTNAQTNLATGTIGYFRAEYNLPAATNNLVQSDSATFNIVFTLNQH
jgi:predicted ribosomally synthesized peptide with SipW-like signal peptide